MSLTPKIQPNVLAPKTPTLWNSRAMKVLLVTGIVAAAILGAVSIWYKYRQADDSSASNPSATPSITNIDPFSDPLTAAAQGHEEALQSHLDKDPLNTDLVLDTLSECIRYDRKDPIKLIIAHINASPIVKKEVLTESLKRENIPLVLMLLKSKYHLPGDAGHKKLFKYFADNQWVDLAEYLIYNFPALKTACTLDTAIRLFGNAKTARFMKYISIGDKPFANENDALQFLQDDRAVTFNRYYRSLYFHASSQNWDRVLDYLFARQDSSVYNHYNFTMSELLGLGDERVARLIREDRIELKMADIQTILNEATESKAAFLDKYDLPTVFRDAVCVNKMYSLAQDLYQEAEDKEAFKRQLLLGDKLWLIKDFKENGGRLFALLFAGVDCASADLTPEQITTALVGSPFVAHMQMWNQELTDPTEPGNERLRGVTTDQVIQDHIIPLIAKVDMTDELYNHAFLPTATTLIRLLDICEFLEIKKLFTAVDTAYIDRLAIDRDMKRERDVSKIRQYITGKKPHDRPAMAIRLLVMQHKDKLSPHLPQLLEATAEYELVGSLIATTAEQDISITLTQDVIERLHHNAIDKVVDQIHLHPELFTLDEAAEVALFKRIFTLDNFKPNALHFIPHSQHVPALQKAFVEAKGVIAKDTDWQVTYRLIMGRECSGAFTKDEKLQLLSHEIGDDSIVDSLLEHEDADSLRHLLTLANGIDPSEIHAVYEYCKNYFMNETVQNVVLNFTFNNFPLLVESLDGRLWNEISKKLQERLGQTSETFNFGAALDPCLSTQVNGKSLIDALLDKDPQLVASLSQHMPPTNRVHQYFTDKVIERYCTLPGASFDQMIKRLPQTYFSATRLSSLRSGFLAFFRDTDRMFSAKLNLMSRPGTKILLDQIIANDHLQAGGIFTQTLRTLYDNYGNNQPNNYYLLAYHLFQAEAVGSYAQCWETMFPITDEVTESGVLSRLFAERFTALTKSNLSNENAIRELLFYLKRMNADETVSCMKQIIDQNNGTSVMAELLLRQISSLNQGNARGIYQECLQTIFDTLSSDQLKDVMLVHHYYRSRPPVLILAKNKDSTNQAIARWCNDLCRTIQRDCPAAWHQFIPIIRSGAAIPASGADDDMLRLADTYQHDARAQLTNCISASSIWLDPKHAAYNRAYKVNTGHYSAVDIQDAVSISRNVPTHPLSNLVNLYERYVLSKQPNNDALKAQKDKIAREMQSLSGDGDYRLARNNVIKDEITYIFRNIIDEIQSGRHDEDSCRATLEEIGESLSGYGCFSQSLQGDIFDQYLLLKLHIKENDLKKLSTIQFGLRLLDYRSGIAEGLIPSSVGDAYHSHIMTRVRNLLKTRAIKGSEVRGGDEDQFAHSLENNTTNQKALELCFDYQYQPSDIAQSFLEYIEEQFVQQKHTQIDALLESFKNYTYDDAFNQAFIPYYREQAYLEEDDANDLDEMKDYIVAYIKDKLEDSDTTLEEKRKLITPWLIENGYLAQTQVST